MSRKLKGVISLMLAAALLIPTGWLVPVAQAAAAPEIPVILYHKIVANPADDYSTNLDNFTNQMKYLSDNGYVTLSAEQYIDILDGKESAPAKAILLTFDDGTPDFITNALPILKQHAMKSVEFIVTDWIDGGYSMTSAQLQALASEPSVSLQNHSKTHNNTAATGGVWTNTITKQQANDEIAAANVYLKGKTGKDPVLLAYPYGAFNANAETAAKENGIKYAFKVGYPNESNHFTMGRNVMMQTTTLSQFATMVGGPAPAEEPAAPAGRPVLSQSFEDGSLGGWADLGWNGTGTTVISSTYASEGSKSLKYTSRSDRKSSPTLDLTQLLIPDHVYDISFKLRSGDGTDIYHLGSKIVTDGTTDYPWIIPNQNVTDSAWTTFQLKNYKVPSKTTQFQVWIEADIYSTSSTAKADFYLDEFVIRDMTAAPVLAPITFEDHKVNGFEGRAGKEQLTVTDEANHTTGSDAKYALKVEGRTETWNGPSLHVEKYIDEGYEYQITAWAKLISPASTTLKLSTQIGNGDGASYNTISSKAVNDSDGWIKLEGTYRYSNTSSGYVTLYVESASDTASFYIDDVSFIRTDSIPPAIQKDITPIQDAYKDDFLIGNAVSMTEMDGIRLELLKMHHNIVTAENAMKPEGLYKDGVFDPTAADALVAKIQAAGLQLHGHVLVWHQQTPAFLNTTTDAQGKTVPLGREVALANLQTHITTVMEHFGNKVISWDVVNEAMNDNPANPTNWKAALRSSPWYQAIGDDYIEQSFLAARAVLDAHPDWNIKLYYNDYNEDNQNKATAITSMVKDINDRYALTHPGKKLIDGVGMQGHYNTNTNPDNVKMSLEKFISLGVQVAISELDISAGSNSKLTDKEANAQGYLYAQLMNIFKAHKANIQRVTFWGLNDSTSWRASNSPLLFDKNLQAKPAYNGVLNPDQFMAEHPPASATANQANAKFGTPDIDGIADAVWDDAPQININRYQMAWQGASGVAKALWDDENLYVLIQVNDAQLDKKSSNAYEQDSIEVFLDQNNAKTAFYQDDDGQYRVNFDNETSFNPPSIADGFVSATKVSGTNYTVEVKIPLKSITPGNDTKLGFDVQINDAKDGVRQSVAAWNDTTGQGYQDTSVFGVLTLIGKASPDNGGPIGGGGGSAPQTGAVEIKDGIVTIKPGMTFNNGRVQGAISADNLKKALELAPVPAANGRKQFVVDLPKQADAKSYDMQVPTASLKGQEVFDLLMKTDFAALRIPSNMLSNVTTTTDQVSIRVDKASTDSLDAATREQIGSRPVINLSEVAGDTVLAWNNPSAPVTVAIPYTPTAEELSHPDQIVIWYIDGKGNATPVPNSRYDAATGTVVFRMTHFSTYAVAFVSKTFGDLQNVPWANSAIDAMAARDIIRGTAANSFTPAASIKRADFIALLVRALELKSTGKNESAFSDVQTTDYYYDELVIAKELGIATGFADHTFRPNSTISRQDMMVLTARALAAAGKQVQGAGSLDAYSDAASISGYATDSAAALVKGGIVNGKNGGLIAPNDSLTRAEAAVILYRVWKL